MRDTKVKFLSDLSSTPESLFDTFAAALTQEYPDHLPLFQVILTRTLKRSKQTKASEGSETSVRAFEAVLTAAHNVSSRIDTAALAMEFGVNVDKDDKVALARRKDFDLKKCALVDALVATALALLSLKKLDQENSAALNEQLQTTVKELQRWDDINTDRHWQLNMDKNKAEGKTGAVLKKVLELISTLTEGKTKNDVVSIAELREVHMSFRSYSKNSNSPSCIELSIRSGMPVSLSLVKGGLTFLNISMLGRDF
jgi:hypothetical protein